MVLYSGHIEYELYHKIHVQYYIFINSVFFNLLLNIFNIFKLINAQYDFQAHLWAFEQW